MQSEAYAPGNKADIPSNRCTIITRTSSEGGSRLERRRAEREVAALWSDTRVRLAETRP